MVQFKSREQYKDYHKQKEMAIASKLLFLYPARCIIVVILEKALFFKDHINRWTEFELISVCRVCYFLLFSWGKKHCQTYKYILTIVQNCGRFGRLFAVQTVSDKIIFQVLEKVSAFYWIRQERKLRSPNVLVWKTDYIIKYV